MNGRRFSRTRCELVNNPNCNFYNLWVDGKCLFNEFYNEVSKNSSDFRHMTRIVAMMDSFSEHIKLPAKKFRQVKGAGRQDLFEFKYQDIRVYILLCMPDIYLILGGYKHNQKADINRLKRQLKDFNTDIFKTLIL